MEEAEYNDYWMLVQSLGNTNIRKKSMKDIFYITADLASPLQNKKRVYRGVNLGSVVTDKQWNAIETGRFDNMYLGDYWQIGGVIYRIMDFNYWFGSGDIKCDTNHIVIMPDHSVDHALYKMNDTATVEGGYVGSKMETTYINNTKNIIRGAFGSSHILHYREMLTNSAQNGRPNAAMNYTVDIAIPNGAMIFGVMHPDLTPYDVHVYSYKRLSALVMNYHIANLYRQSYWLRDIVGENNFLVNNSANRLGSNVANASYQIRPVFGICKENKT